MHFKRPLSFAFVFAMSASLFASPGASAAGLPLEVNGKHIMWGRNQGYPSTSEASANNLIFHGGTVEVDPAVYIVYWGPAWQAGFTETHGSFTYTSSTIQNYINSFFSGIGGGAWAGVQTQYCDGIPAPAFSCAGQ